LQINWNPLLYYSTWRNQRKKYGADTYVGSGHKRISADNKEQRILVLEKENA
jgi:hypothetical protein